MIQINSQHLQNLVGLKELLQAKDKGSDPSAKRAAIELMQIVSQAIILAQQYNVVIANPPYMGLKFQNATLKAFMKKDYSEFSKDIFASFMVRCSLFTKEGGQTSFVTPYVWMFIISYESLRNYFYLNSPFTSLIQLEYNSFSPACIPVCCFSTQKGINEKFKGTFINLARFKGSDNQSPRTIEAINSEISDYKYHFSSSDLNNIPGKPLIYWAEEKILESFSDEINYQKVGAKSTLRKGMSTGDNPKFVRVWSEINLASSNITQENDTPDLKWFAYNNGGEYRKWYGNIDRVVNWEKDGFDIKNFFDDRGNLRSVARGVDQKFKTMLSWTSLSSTNLGVRYYEDKFLSDQNGNFIIDTEDELYFLLAYLCTPVAQYIVKTLNPTMHILVSNVAELPVPKDINVRNIASGIAKECISLSKNDWDSFEISWNFKCNPLVVISKGYAKKLKDIYFDFIEFNKNITNKVSLLEKQNNTNFINIFGLEKTLQADVEDIKITL